MNEDDSSPRTGVGPEHVRPHATQRPSSLLVIADSLDGGMGAAALGQCALFARAGWRVDLAAPAAMSSAADGIHRHDLDVPVSAFKVAAMLRGARQARRLVHDLDSDIVHVHGLRTLAVLAAGGTRPFVTLHSSGRNPGQTAVGTWIRKASRGIAPLFARGAFSVVPVARGRWSTMLVPSPRLEALDRKAPGELASHPLFVFPARLAPPKRPELFIDAMAALAERVPGVEGVVLGEGPDRTSLEARILATGAPVRLLGYVEDPTPWYRQAWGVCLLSDFESLPFVVQEAMWAGRAVVSSDLPGV
jgi:glycosyltransferase involved in cell wall biosynthesis